MTNHIHLLATPAFDDSISKTFQSAGRKYVQYFNFTQKRSGTLWEGRYRATVVDTQAYFLKLMRYIEMNPVRAGMVAHARDYRWSSHGRYAYGEDNLNQSWLTEHDEYTRLGLNANERKIAYRALFKEVMSHEELGLIREASHKGWALGSERFQREIEVLSLRRAVSKGKGRPRKVVEAEDG
jgi:putative transposase